MPTPSHRDRARFGPLPWPCGLKYALAWSFPSCQNIKKTLVAPQFKELERGCYHGVGRIEGILDEPDVVNEFLLGFLPLANSFAIKGDHPKILNIEGHFVTRLPYQDAWLPRRMPDGEFIVDVRVVIVEICNYQVVFDEALNDFDW
jgi:hypothetical protein